MVQTAVYLTNELVLDTRFHQLDAAADGTLFAWANALAIVSSPSWSSLPARVGSCEHARGRSGPGLGLLALDDATAPTTGCGDSASPVCPVHPRTAEAVALAAFALLLAIVFVLLWAESDRAPARAKAMMRAGLLALAFAVATRLVGAVFGRHETYSDAVRAVGVAVEQGSGPRGLDPRRGRLRRQRPRFSPGSFFLAASALARIHGHAHGEPAPGEHRRPDLARRGAKTRWFTR